MIALIGSGNVATWIAHRLRTSKNFPVAQVYSRNLEHAAAVAHVVGGEAIDDLSRLNPHCEAYIFSIKDDAYPDVLSRLPFSLPLALHTAGSVSQTVFEGYANEYGVLYPLQTFTKSADMNALNVPICWELDKVGDVRKARVRQLMQELTPLQYAVDEHQRERLHLAAVFACNFGNAMYRAADELLREQSLPFEMLLPLLEQTLDKVRHMSPEEAQTGPARRADQQVIQKHLRTLNNTQLHDIYETITRYIQQG